MNHCHIHTTTPQPAPWGTKLLQAMALTALLAAVGLAHAQAPFAKPEQVTDALIDAVATSDVDALPRLLGKDWRAWLMIWPRHRSVSV